MDINQQAQLAWDIIENTNTNIFLTGKAGTGKTTFLRRLKEESSKRIVVVAPTGIAAINAEGVTIHSFFQLSFAPFIPDAQYKLKEQQYRFSKQKIRVIQSIDTLVIDEISMVRADLLDAVDNVLRRFRKNNLPFGGVQMVMIGDLGQLAPVAKDDEWQMLSRYYDTPYFFSSLALKSTRYAIVELKTVYRQSDSHFVELLNRVRDNRADDSVLAALNSRYIPNFQPPVEEGYIRLTTHNFQAQQENDRQLALLPGKPYTYEASITGKYPEMLFPTEQTLTLKEGAQVMFVKNDSSADKAFYNGMLGTVTEINDKNLFVRTKDTGVVIKVEPEQWENTRYEINERTNEITEEVEGTFTQFPVKPAWAITVHKSQGLTFEKATIDFGSGTFAGGQAYVALSRCRSLEGMTLCQPVTHTQVFVRPEVTQFASHFNDEGAVQRALQTAKADIEYEAAIRCFNEGDIPEALNHFFVAIHARYDIEKPLPRRFLQYKLGIIRRLREENKALKAEMLAQQRQLQKYAREYYEMGNVCITEAHNAQAALKNYDKAIELYPTFIDAWTRKGVTLMDEGDYHEAQKCLKKVTKMSPTYFKGWYNLGRLHLAMNEFGMAINDFSHATSLKQEHARSYELLGDALARNGQEEEAQLNWSIAEQLRKKKNKG